MILNVNIPLTAEACSFLSADLIQELERFRIFTLNQLLSSTFGLSRNLQIFETSKERASQLEILFQYIPEGILAEYRDSSFSGPTGLLIRNQNESHE